MSRHGEQTDDMLREELGEFGFSDKEIDVYLTLLSQGEATTGTISDDANVTQQAVYTITDRLEDRGLVRVNDHASPKTIRAIPPEESMTTLTSRIDSITPVLKERFNDTEPQTPELKMVKSQKTAIKRLRDAISKAQREVIVAIPEHIYPEIESELRLQSDEIFLFSSSSKTWMTRGSTKSIYRCRRCCSVLERKCPISVCHRYPVKKASDNTVGFDR